MGKRSNDRRRNGKQRHHKPQGDTLKFEIIVIGDCVTRPWVESLMDDTMYMMINEINDGEDCDSGYFIMRAVDGRMIQVVVDLLPCTAVLSAMDNDSAFDAMALLNDAEGKLSDGAFAELKRLIILNEIEEGRKAVAKSEERTAVVQFVSDGQHRFSFPHGM